MAKIEPPSPGVVPVLGFTHTIPGDDLPGRLVIGYDGLTLDGKPFPYVTAGDWVLTFPEAGLAVLNIPIVVTLAQDPATVNLE